MQVAQLENTVVLWLVLLDSVTLINKTIMEKRYQYYSRNGIQWTPWFEYEGSQEPWQLKNKLKNEYR